MLNCSGLRYHSSGKKNKASEKKNNNGGAYEEIDRSGIIRTSIEEALDRQIYASYTKTGNRKRMKTYKEGDQNP